MKVAVSLVFVSTLIAGCSSTNQSSAQGADVSYSRQVASAKHAIEHAPAWMFDLPKDPSMIFESATSTSSDFSMADVKARTIAFSKICQAAGGKVRSQTKLYRSDNNAASSEQSDMTIRSLCPDVDITGVQTISLKHVAEGNLIRTYVLVGLPIGSSNILKSSKESIGKAPEAFKELDSMMNKSQPTKADEISASTSGSKKNFKLLDVDNDEYKRRRDDALQKSNAVIGQVTVDGQ